MNIAVILAGGMGSRVGSHIPKQFIEIEGRPIISYCLDGFTDNDSVDAIQIVADGSWHEYIRRHMDRDGLAGKWKGFSEPGANRQLSIFHALKDALGYAGHSDYIMIQDAVRPMAGRGFIRKCFEMAQGRDGVLPVLPMKDTVYLSRDGRGISSLLTREEVFAGQAPEVFLLGKYLEANLALLPDRIMAINGSTEPAVMAGMDILMIDGDRRNFKITTKEDMERFRQELERRKRDSG